MSDVRCELIAKELAERIGLQARVVYSIDDMRYHGSCGGHRWAFTMEQWEAASNDQIISDIFDSYGRG